MASKIIINEKLCKKCGICAQFCPKKVLEIDKDQRPGVIAPQDCINCKQCVFRCPDFALELEEQS